MNQNNQGGVHDGSNVGSSGGDGSSSGNSSGGGASGLKPHQVNKLVQVYHNEIRQARAPGVDPSKVQEHFKKAEQLKQILVKYQNLRAMQQQQQQQQQQVPPTVPTGQNQGMQSMQDNQQHLPQSLPQMGNLMAQNMNYQLGQQQASSVPQRLTQSAQSPQLMAGTPGAVRTPSSAMNSPMMGNQQNSQIRGLPPQQQMPQGQLNRPLSQQQQQILQGTNRTQFANANSGNTLGNPNTAGHNTANLPEQFNQLRSKYEKLRSVREQLERLRSSLQNAADIEKYDRDIAKAQEKEKQFMKLILMVKNQIIELQNQSSSSQNQGSTTTATTGSQGFQQGIANSPAMSNGQRQPPVRAGLQQPPQQTSMPQQNQNRTFPQQVTTPVAPVSATPRHLPVTATQPNNAAIPSSNQSSPPPSNMSQAGGSLLGEANKATPVAVPGQKLGSASASASAAGTPSSTTGKQATKTTPVPLQAGRPSPAPNPALASITRSSVPLTPISNTINVKPPQPVTLKQGSSRPTITGGVAVGMGSILGTPAISKLPTLELASGSGTGGTIQDNGGRVLTKRKLSELVNTIGADEGDGKTVIDGDVEELLLDLADEFISSVTSFACRLAKHRKVDTLDVRDVQLHLERNWNIRIPGYAMDEIKATRKWQPSTSYNQKLQGVEIAKSVNGNLK